MTVVILGIDALDPDLIASDAHPNLVLKEHKEIEPVISTATDEPSTHESWPSIITGLQPKEHGLELEKGIEWENPVISYGSKISNHILPGRLQSKIGAWLLSNTDEGAFRVPCSYYEENGISTIFDDVKSKPIGIPNYVRDSDDEDREHELRKSMGDLFEHDPGSEGKHKHSSSNPAEFYELCMEMSMIRIARTRRALRSRKYELVFGYTSGLDLIGHISYQLPGAQGKAYKEIDEFVGELREDLSEDDEMVIISDHGLQDGIHTNTAFLSGTNQDIVQEIDSVLELRGAVERELEEGHLPNNEFSTEETDPEKREEVKEHLEDLGYM